MNTELKFLSEEGIRDRAPSVFTQKPSPKVSKHYSFIPTYQVINDMRALGWDVVDAKEVSSKNENKGFQKHTVTFRNPDVFIKGKDGDDVFPQIILMNSHDAANSFQFIAGLFRLVCSNGLIIADERFGDIANEKTKIRHMGYDFDELKKVILNITKALPLTVESMNKMKETEIAQEGMIKFAQEAVKCRFDEKEIKRIKINYEDLITPIRKEDEAKNVWSIYNIVQEKLITGDFEYSSGSKIRKAREIKSFIKDQKINKELFNLALECVS